MSMCHLYNENHKTLMKDSDEYKCCFQTLVEIYLLSRLVMPLTFNLSTQGAEIGRAL